MSQQLLDVIDTNITVFAHRDIEEGNEFLFNITSLLDDPRVKKHTIRKIDCNPHYATLAIKQWGIEGSRLRELLAEEDYINEAPIIMADHGDGYHTIIDGNHRYVSWTLKRHVWIYAKILKKKIWQDHLIMGVTSKMMDLLIGQQNIPGQSMREALQSCLPRVTK